MHRNRISEGMLLYASPVMVPVSKYWTRKRPGLPRSTDHMIAATGYGTGIRLTNRSTRVRSAWGPAAGSRVRFSKRIR